MTKALGFHVEYHIDMYVHSCKLIYALDTPNAQVLLVLWTYMDVQLYMDA